LCCRIVESISKRLSKLTHVHNSTLHVSPDVATESSEWGRWDVTQVVAALLRAGAGVDSQDHAGWTPLHLAVWNEHFRVVVQLVEAGAQCSVRTREGNTPMHYTLMLVNPSLTKVLLKAGAEPAVLNANG
jgi:ankyrin repeat protein